MIEQLVKQDYLTFQEASCCVSTVHHLDQMTSLLNRGNMHEADEKELKKYFDKMY